MGFLPWSSGRFLLHEEAPLDILSKSTAKLYAKPSIGSGILVYAVIPSQICWTCHVICQSKSFAFLTEYCVVPDVTTR